MIACAEPRSVYAESRSARTACPEIRREPRSTCPELIGKVPVRSAPQIPALSERVAQHPRHSLGPFLGLSPTCPEEARGISHSPSPLISHCPLTCPDPVRPTPHSCFKSFTFNTSRSPRKCCKPT